MKPVNCRPPASSTRASIWKVSSSPRKRASAASSNSSVSVDRGRYLRENKSGSIRSFSGKSVARLRESYLTAERVQRAWRLPRRCGPPAFIAGGTRGGGRLRTEFRSEFRPDCSSEQRQPPRSRRSDEMRLLALLRRRRLALHLLRRNRQFLSARDGNVADHVDRHLPPSGGRAPLPHFVQRLLPRGGGGAGRPSQQDRGRPGGS